MEIMILIGYGGWWCGNGNVVVVWMIVYGGINISGGDVHNWWVVAVDGDAVGDKFNLD